MLAGQNGAGEAKSEFCAVDEKEKSSSLLVSAPREIHHQSLSRWSAIQSLHARRVSSENRHSNEAPHNVYLPPIVVSVSQQQKVKRLAY
jgi:hypothetical protein